MAVVKEFAFANEPVPLDVQAIPALLLALEPVVIITAPVLEQVLMAVPATAVATAFTVTVGVPLGEDAVQPLASVTEDNP